MTPSLHPAPDSAPGPGLGPALRARIEAGYADLLRAFDAAEGGTDPAAAAALREATDALMRALAQVVIRLGSDPA